MLRSLKEGKTLIRATKAPVEPTDQGDFPDKTLKRLAGAADAQAYNEIENSFEKVRNDRRESAPDPTQQSSRSLMVWHVRLSNESSSFLLRDYRPDQGHSRVITPYNENLAAGIL